MARANLSPDLKKLGILRLFTMKDKKTNVRMNYPKPVNSIVSYVALLFSLVLIMLAVYGIDALVAMLATKFF